MTSACLLLLCSTASYAHVDFQLAQNANGQQSGAPSQLGQSSGGQQQRRPVTAPRRGSNDDGQIQRGVLAVGLLAASAGVSYWVYVDPTSVAAQPLTIISSILGGGSLFALVTYLIFSNRDNGPELGRLNVVIYPALAFIPGAIVGGIVGGILSLQPPNRFPTTVTGLGLTNLVFVPLLFGLWKF